MGDIVPELCTGQKNEPQMGKRETEGKKEKKQKKDRKEKRQQYRGLYLNPLLVPRARAYACERVRTRAREGSAWRSPIAEVSDRVDLPP